MPAVSQFDSRSERNIATLLPKAQEQARVFLQKVLDANISAKITSATRTFAEQDALFAQGRTAPGHIVTKARGGFSNHNFGIAWDITIFEGKTPLDESPLYDAAGKIGKDLGLEWGGDFKTLVDKPHFQCRTGKSLAQLRALHTAGTAIPIQDLKLPPKVTVTVTLNGQEKPIPALLISNQTFVGVRAFVETLGGNLAQAGGSPFTATVNQGGTERVFAGQIIDSVGYVKFADINGLYGLAFLFDNKTLRLALTKP